MSRRIPGLFQLSGLSCTEDPPAGAPATRRNPFKYDLFRSTIFVETLAIFCSSVHLCGEALRGQELSQEGSVAMTDAVAVIASLDFTTRRVL